MNRHLAGNESKTAAVQATAADVERLGPATRLTDLSRLSDRLLASRVDEVE